MEICTTRVVSSSMSRGLLRPDNAAHLPALGKQANLVAPVYMHSSCPACLPIPSSQVSTVPRYPSTVYMAIFHPFGVSHKQTFFSLVRRRRSRACRLCHDVPNCPCRVGRLIFIQRYHALGHPFHRNLFRWWAAVLRSSVEARISSSCI